ncbi:hypothetical protein D3C81_1596900 [compost metagenome]|uniref:hypothetical protein n=1 Tax=Janthinobacterium lividum TaxID=29581 RepID=UPI000FA9FCF1|nr:hypothetical protein [Janthinobacterium lividum]
MAKVSMALCARKAASKWWNRLAVPSMPGRRTSRGEAWVDVVIAAIITAAPAHAPSASRTAWGLAPC